ncbi:uncharacterized, partial [Tachysurus ichikawai]
MGRVRVGLRVGLRVGTGFDTVAAQQELKQ